MYIHINKTCKILLWKWYNFIQLLNKSIKILLKELWL